MMNIMGPEKGPSSPEPTGDSSGEREAEGTGAAERDEADRIGAAERDEAHRIGSTERDEADRIGATERDSVQEKEPEAADSKETETSDAPKEATPEEIADFNGAGEEGGETIGEALSPDQADAVNGIREGLAEAEAEVAAKGEMPEVPEAETEVAAEGETPEVPEAETEAAAEGETPEVPEAEGGEQAETPPVEAKIEQAQAVLQEATESPTAFRKFWNGFKKRTERVQALGLPVRDILIGIGVGMVARTVTRMVLGSGGLPILLAAGAVGGGASAAFRKYRTEKRAYNDFVTELEGERAKASGEVLVTHIEGLRTQLAAETNAKKREAIGDQIRYAGVYVKRESKEGEVATALEATEIIDQLIAGSGEKEQSNATKEILHSIEKAKPIDRRKMAKAVLKGAMYGAAGAVMFGFLVDQIAGIFNPDDVVPPPGVEGTPTPGVEGTPTPGVEGTPPPGVEGTPTPGVEGTPTPGVEAGAGTGTGGPDDVPGAGETPGVEAGTGGPDDVPGAGETPGVEVDIPDDIEAPSLEILPNGLEQIELSEGSNPWREMASYMEENLGREATPEEIQTAVMRVVADSDIAVPEWGIEGGLLHTELPVGTELDLTGANEYIESLINPEEAGLITPDFAAMPEVVSLSEGSNLWNETEGYLQSALGRDPTDAEILSISKLVAQSSNIAVPEWGISGDILPGQISTGTVFNFTPDIKSTIVKMG